MPEENGMWKKKGTTMEKGRDSDHIKEGAL
jgi:hypothetical protein